MKQLRTLDANINRLREGLRVIEDILRYEYNAENFIKDIKTLRHKLAKVDKPTFIKRIKYRDSVNDEGYNNKGENESVRENTLDLLRANFLRAQEASRVLEEVLKKEFVENNYSELLKEIRYSLYEIEKRVFISFEKIMSKNLDLSLYLVTSGDLNNNPLQEIVEKAIKGGVTCVQLREKYLEDKDIIETGHKVKEVCRKYNVPFIVDDRVDICLALDADGVHLGQTDLPVNIARDILGNDKLIGFSTNSIELVKEANNLPVDYIGFGSIYKTPTKESYKEVGLDIIKEVNKISEKPIAFIGGITLDTFKDVKKAGAKNICVVRAIMSSENPEQAARTLRK